MPLQGPDDRLLLCVDDGIQCLQMPLSLTALSLAATPFQPTAVTTLNMAAAEVRDHLSDCRATMLQFRAIASACCQPVWIHLWACIHADLLLGYLLSPVVTIMKSVNSATNVKCESATADLRRPALATLTQ